ncbi:MAG TPA: hypothetical protein VMH27_04485 [Puia sp.]|nr:hypothetical protein [Puia sp.]
MSDSTILTCPLSPEDRSTLTKLLDRVLFVWARLYVPLLLFLVYIYFKMQPGGTFRGNTLKYSKSEFAAVFPFFAAFFGLLFLGFMIRDFRRMILPFIKEFKRNEKRCYSFPARKYLDPIYDKRLLFYPGKEDVYIEVAPEDFDVIGNSEQLQLEVGSVTGEVLRLGDGSRVFSGAKEFSFKDM